MSGITAKTSISSLRDVSIWLISCWVSRGTPRGTLEIISRSDSEVSMQFTEKYITALKSKEQRYDIREKSGNGFGLRVFPSGEKSFIFFYTFEGRKRRMTLGSYPALTLAEARHGHRKALSMLENGRDPGFTKQMQKIDARISPTVDELVKEYLEKWAKPRKRSWREDERILNKDVVTSFGKRKAKDVTKRDILLLLDKIKERNSPIAANRTLACVRRMFNFAVERDIISVSPCLSVKAPANENRRDRVLSEEEILLFWRGLDDAPMSPGTKLALKFQLTTAQRKGEVVSAEWSDINLNSSWWIIPANKSKNKISHRIPLSSLAIQLLQEVKLHSNNSRFLFPSPIGDSHVTGSAVDHALRKCIINLKKWHEEYKEIEAFTPHDLRRSAATRMSELGIFRLVISKLLNHVERSFTSIYDRHTYDKEKKIALELWAKKLDSIINGVEVKNNVIQMQKVV